MAVAGATPERLTTVDGANGELQHAYPQRLPGGDVLFGVMTDRGWHFAVLALADTRAAGQVRALGQPGSGAAGAQYVPQTGHVLYANAGGLVAVPFDAASGQVPGSPVPLLERPEVDPSGSAAFAVSASGTLAYMPRALTLPQRALVLVDRSGRATVLQDTRAAYTHPRLSPDGRRLVYAVESDSGSEIWIYDIERGTPTPLVTGGVNRYPIWSHDGQQITFQSARAGGVSLYSKRVDGSGEPEALIRSASDQGAGLSRALAGLLPGTMPVFTSANPHLPMAWTSDGVTLAFDERKPSAEHDIWVLTRGGEPSPFQRTDYDESAPAFSPDGKWLAYVSDESGRSAVWVQPFPGPGPKWLITRDGGTEPAWSRSGNELYFRRADQLIAVPVTPGAEFVWGKPQVVFESRYRDDRRRAELRRVARRQDFCRRAQRGRRRLGSVQCRAQLVRGAEVTKMSDKSRAHRQPRPTTARVKAPREESQRTRVAASLDAWLARDWTKAVHVGSLEEFQQVQVCTQNTLYELIVINRCGDVRVRGGRYFPEWTAARFAGSTAGGSFLKCLAINLGFQMEFELDRRRIITSPVRTIAILEKAMTV